jgi:hypothetical protein
MANAVSAAASGLDRAQQGEEEEDAALDRIASGQKMMLVAILANFALAAMKTQVNPLALIFFYLGAAFLSLFGLMRLSKGLEIHVGFRVILFVLAFVPVVNIIMLFILSRTATGKLKDAGLEVGLLGAKDGPPMLSGSDFALLALVAVLLCGGYFASKSLLLGRLQAGAAGTMENPCQFVGVWTSSREGSVYEVRLHDNGSFVARPIARGNNMPGMVSGKWKVVEEKMVWLYNEKPGARDVNTIRVSSERSFTLTEGNGQQTQFNLIQSLESPRCQH